MAMESPVNLEQVEELKQLLEYRAEIGVYRPPLIDPFDRTQRVTWDTYTDGQHYGERLVWLIGDKETEKTINIKTLRSMAFYMGLHKRPSRPFVSVADRMWQISPGSSFIVAFLKYKYDQWWWQFQYRHDPVYKAGKALGFILGWVKGGGIR